MNYEFESSDKSTKNDVKDWIKSIAIAIIAAIFIHTFLFNIIEVKGSSMHPTLEEHDRLILKKYEAVLKIEDYVRGDIVVFKSPLKNDNRYFIKRVIGVPGDTIDIMNGKLYINDEEIIESYIENDSYTESLNFGENHTVQENELFVLGDNRLPGKSNDSRSFGSVSIEQVEGKIVLRILPLKKIDKDF